MLSESSNMSKVTHLRKIRASIRTLAYENLKSSLFLLPYSITFFLFISQIFIIKTALEAGDTISILEGETNILERQQGYPLLNTISRTQP